MKALLALLLLTAVAHGDTLDNGMRVIVAPDDTVNSIVVYLRYQGGYAEDPNTAVLDQLFANAEHDARLDAIGGFAVSNFDAHHTDVFEVVPAGALELALWFEAKRMTMRITRVDTPTQAELATDVAIDKLLWPRRRAKPASATLESVRALAKARLVPSNATLVIAGRIEPPAALAMARRYFGTIPAGKPTRLAEDKRDAPTERTAYVNGSEPATIVAARIDKALAVALVVEQLLGPSVEIRDNEELRVINPEVSSVASQIRALALDEVRVRAARKAAGVKLLLKLETLPYRARVLAEGIDIEALGKQVARVTAEDVQAFADDFEAASVTVEARP